MHFFSPQWSTYLHVNFEEWLQSDLQGFCICELDLVPIMTQLDLTTQVLKSLQHAFDQFLYNIRYYMQYIKNIIFVV